MNIWQTVLRNLRYPRRHTENEYELLVSEPNVRSSSLPIPNNSRRRAFRSCFHLFTLRRVLVLLSSILLFLLLLVLVQGIPPDFQDIRTFERNLPQHNLSDPSFQDGLYLRFPNHLWGHGLNNVLQEALLMSYIAYATQRSFVFEDYVWSHAPFPYTIYDFALRPTRMPLNAFISGPTAGGPTQGPRAVSAQFWDVVCPKEARRIISSEDEPSQEEGSVIVDWWVHKLKDIQDPCVQIDSSSIRIFDHAFFGSSRVLSVWPGLSASPIMKQFIWSPLVFSGVLRNFPLLQPSSAKDLLDISSSTTLSGLVAVHLRRGDYKRHCPRLAHWQASYMGFNQHPSLLDRFDPSPYADQPHFRKEAYYLEHCLPSVDQIVARLHALRVEHPTLRRVYVLTNGWSWWLNRLKSALVSDGWDDLKSSLDLDLDSEQKWVAMAVDMTIAGRAEVFLGNGFSSLSSNIIMLRIAKGLDFSTNRFL